MNQQNKCAILLALGAIALAPVSTQATTVVVGGDAIEIGKTLPDATDLWVSGEDFERITGFELKPQGACFEELCIPIKQDRDSDLFVKRDGASWFNVTEFADKVQQAYVVDRDEDVWSFGLVPATRKSFLESGVAPDFELKDRNGELVRLSDFRGKKVLIVTWASW